MLYLDTAATTYMLPCAVEAFLSAPQGNPSSAHAEGIKAREALEQARSEIASCINAHPSEVFFTSGSTEACNHALYMLKRYCKNVAFPLYEHHAVIEPASKPSNLYAIYSQGFAQMLANNETGEIYKDIITERIEKLTAPNEAEPDELAKKIERTEKRKGLLFFSDATSAVGHIPVDFKALDVDYMAFGGHKFGAPKGIGCLVIKQKAPKTPLITGGGQEQGLRGGTVSVPLAVSMAAALKYLTANMELHAQEISMRRDYLIRGIMSQIESAHINGPWTNDEVFSRLPNNINVSFEHLEGTSLVLMLSNMGFMVSSGSACTSGNFYSSHVLAAMGVPSHIAKGTIRITLPYGISYQQCDDFLDALKLSVKSLREIGGR